MRHSSLFRARGLAALLPLLLASVCFAPSSLVAQDFRRGDVDGDGVAGTMGDVATYMPVMLSGEFTCQDAADINDDGSLNLADLAALLTFVVGDLPMPAPGPLVCGPDPTLDGIGCDLYTACAAPRGLPFSPDHVLRIASDTALIGEMVSVAVTFDNFLGDAVQAVSLGVCHDENDLTLIGVDVGDHFALAAADYFQVRTTAGGWELTLATNLLACDSCAQVLDGVGQEIAVARYAPQAAGNFPLEFCTGLVAPETPISVGVASLAIFSEGFAPATVDGSIEGVAAPVFRRGDANHDSNVDIADAVALLSILFGGAPLPTCLDAGDANDDAKVDIADSVTVLGVLFLGATPLPPGPVDCGVDPTDDTLSCDSYPAC